MTIRTAKILLTGVLIGACFGVAAQNDVPPVSAKAAEPRESASHAAETPAAETPTPDAISLQLARVVAGMLGYTYWPEAASARTLCVMPQSHFAAVLLDKVPLIKGREQWQATAQADASVQTVLEACDALYYSASFAQSHSHMLAAVRRKPVLTILEDSATCDEGSLFCIDARSNKRITFQANLEAMSLSTLRVNPQVLRMGRDTP